MPTVTAATVVAGISGPIWGATDESYLFTNSMEETPEREKSELKNGQGQFVQAVWHSPKRGLSVRGKVRTTTGLPGTSLIGHILAIADTEFAGTWFIDTITKSKTEGDWLEFSAELIEYEDSSTGSWTTTTTA